MTSSTNQLTDYIYPNEVVNDFAQLDDKIFKLMVEANGLAKMNAVASDYVVDELCPQINEQLKYLDDYRGLEEWQLKQTAKRLIELINKNDDIAQSAEENLAVIKSNIRKINRRYKLLQVKWHFNIFN